VDASSHFLRLFVAPATFFAPAPLFFRNPLPLTPSRLGEGEQRGTLPWREVGIRRRPLKKCRWRTLRPLPIR
jgi:hypothetical protein